MLVLGQCLNICIDERTIMWSLFCWKMQNFPSKQDKRIFKLFRASVRRADPAILATFSPKFMPHKKSLDQAGWGQGQLWEFCDIVWIFLCGLYSCIFTATKFTTHTYFVCSAWALYALMVCYTKFVRFSFSASTVFPSPSYFCCWIFCHSAHCTVLLAQYCNMLIAILHIVDLFQ